MRNGHRKTVKAVAPVLPAITVAVVGGWLAVNTAFFHEHIDDRVQGPAPVAAIEVPFVDLIEHLFGLLDDIPVVGIAVALFLNLAEQAMSCASKLVTAI